MPPAYAIVVVQPTDLCNLNCTYCYIPAESRRSRNQMSIAVAREIAYDIADQHDRLGVERVSISWHCGEPTTTPVDHMRALLDEFEPPRRRGLVEHVLQTNATRITPDWIDIFTGYEISVGVSLDGPREVMRHRVDWSGRETFDRVMEGMTRLREAGVYHDVIGVVGPETIDQDPAELLRFYEGLGVDYVALNIEECENASVDRRLVTLAEAHEFWMKVIAHLRASGSKIGVRDLRRLSTWLTSTAAGVPIQHVRQIVPTVSWKGDVVLLSPELLGAKAPEHKDFIVGNVLDKTLSEMVGRMDEIGYVREFAQGLANCQATCSFWAFCQGSHASNRYFEHGRFDACETSHCRGNTQAPVTAMLSTIRRDTMPTTPNLMSMEDLLTALAGDPAREAVTDHANWFQSGGGGGKGLAPLKLQP